MKSGEFIVLECADFDSKFDRKKTVWPQGYARTIWGSSQPLQGHRPPLKGSCFVLQQGRENKKGKHEGSQERGKDTCGMMTTCNSFTNRAQG